jgi:Protein of unknown function (DUF4058)
MKSPFPGMDPYIEACGLFEDFHFDLIAEIKGELARVLPSGYLVKTGERAYVVLAQADGKKENVAMRAFISTEYRENFIEIYAAEADRNLVTCIEILSPSNKRSGTPGWDLYLRKRQGLLMGTANFVEIDLLRGGNKMPMVDAWPKSPYMLLVARKVSAPGCRVWPGHSLRPLPSIPIPLLHPDADMPLALQPLIERIHERFHYDRQIDYTRPLTLPLSAEESNWLAEQLQQRATPF